MDTPQQQMPLSAWDNGRAVSSIHGPYCPQCGQLCEQVYNSDSGLFTCEWCEAEVIVRMGESPVGFAWTTYRPAALDTLRRTVEEVTGHEG